MLCLGRCLDTVVGSGRPRRKLHPPRGRRNPGEPLAAPPKLAYPRAMEEKTAAVRPGSPWPLGATWDGEGVNFALASEHADGAKVLVVSPMFPLPPADRERIAPALEILAQARE